MDNNKINKILVFFNTNNERLDVFLAKELILPRSKVQKLIKEQGVFINDKKILKSGFILQNNDKVWVNFDLKEYKQLKSFDVFAKKIDFEISIIHENKDFIVINKPAKLLTHPKLNFNETSVLDFVLQKYPEILKVGENPLRPGIVHRLDEDTSGILIIARNQEAFLKLKQLFKSRLVHKTYWAIIYGQLKENQGTIDKPIARSSKGINKFFVPKENEKYQKPLQLKAAYTEFKVLKENEKFSLVELKPKTGRTHQLRVHLSYLGNSIVGDKVYIYSKQNKSLKFARQMLHAKEIQFKFDDKDYVFKTELPKDFKTALERANFV